MESVLISFIVPVYNTEKYLRHCLDTLVLQTYQNIEIIVVDDSSPDGAAIIIADYQERYPTLIRNFKIPNSGLSGARECGLNNAIGRYIYFVDSDDYVAYNAAELLSRQVLEQEPDIVFAPIVRVPLEGKPTQYNLLKGAPTLETAFKFAACSFSSGMFRTEFLKRFSPMPRMWYEDMGRTRTIISYAENIGYVKAPIYYYVEHEGSITRSHADLRTLDTVAAVNKIMDECNPTYIDFVSAKAAQRILIDLRERWIFADAIIANTKERMRYFLINPKLKTNSQIYKNIVRINELPNEPMPCKVYVGGFGQQNLEERIASTIKERAFWSDGQIEILDEAHCDISACAQTEEAFANKDYAFLNVYFAVMRIWEEGGIYLAHDIVLDKPINCCRYFEAFFSFESAKTFSTKVFGGIKGSSIFKYLIEAFHNPHFSECKMSSAERIKNILVSVGGIKLNGCTQWNLKVIVFSSNIFLIPTSIGFSIAHDGIFDQMPNQTKMLQDLLATFPEEPSPFVESYICNEQIRGNEQKASASVSAPKSKLTPPQPNPQQPKVNGYKIEMEAMQQSLSWRITAPLRKVRKVLVKLGMIK